jgi:ribosomal protein S18 acetylase RimI-like enzyme
MSIPIDLRRAFHNEPLFQFDCGDALTNRLLTKTFSSLDNFVERWVLAEGLNLIGGALISPYTQRTVAPDGFVEIIALGVHVGWQGQNYGHAILKQLGNLLLADQFSSDAVGLYCVSRSVGCEKSLRKVGFSRFRRNTYALKLR